MRKVICFFGVLSWSCFANASLIDFDGLVSDGAVSFSDLGISNTYRNNSWFTNQGEWNDWGIGGDWGVVDCNTITCFGDQSLKAVSGTSYGWSYNGAQSLFIDFQQSTDVNDAYFAGQFNNRGNMNSASIQLFGYDNSLRLISSSMVLNLVDNKWQLLTANLLGIHRLEIRSDRQFSWFAVDDIRINETSTVPEPGSLFLIIFGLSCINFFRRLNAK